MIRFDRRLRFLVLLVATVALGVAGAPRADARLSEEWKRVGGDVLDATLVIPSSWKARGRTDLGPLGKLRGIVATSGDGRTTLVAARLPKNAPSRNLEEAIECFKEGFLEGVDLEGVRVDRRNGMAIIACPGHGAIDGLDARFELVVAADPRGNGYVGVYVAGERDEFADVADIAKKIVASLEPTAKARRRRVV